MKIISQSKKGIAVSAIATMLFLNSCQKEINVSDNMLGQDLQVELKAASGFDASVPNAYYGFMISDLIRETSGFNPPIASRSLGYIGVALYSAVQPGVPGSNSLAGQLQDLASLPETEAGLNYHWPTCANAAMYNIIKDIYENATVENLGILEGIYNDFNASFSAMLSVEGFERSVEYGEAIADAIYTWSTTDGGHEAQYATTDPSYVPPVFFGAWVPTAPSFAAAVLPHWGDVRTFVAANASILPTPHPTFSSSPSSTFYKQALEVYNTDLSLTEEQQDIALFWADGGGTLTPPGHSISMTKQVVIAEGSNLATAALAYSKVGIGVADAFICCWKGKYTYSLMRPITYIQTYIDATWTPFITTPPFPEYASGHSTQSGAFFTTLESIYGTNYAFTDHTWEATMGTRSFDSFEDAAWEASFSRLYGGIHYRSGNRVGVFQGVEIGENVNALDWN